MHHPLQTILLLSLALAGNLGSTGPSQDLCAQDSHPGDLNLWGEGVCGEEIVSLTNFLPLTTVTTGPNTMLDSICVVFLASGPSNEVEYTGLSIVSLGRLPAGSGGITSLSVVLWEIRFGEGPVSSLQVNEFGFESLVPQALRGIRIGQALQALRGIGFGQVLVPQALRGIRIGQALQALRGIGFGQVLVPHALRGIEFGEGLVPSLRGNELGFGQGLMPALQGYVLGFEQCVPALQSHSIFQ
ncbi:hypothetical protein B0H16DRAFT_1695160, partial [Mycena metata]